MKVILINPTLGDYYKKAKVRAAITLSPPLNLAILAGSLRRHGHEVLVWDREARPRLDIEASLRREMPDMVGITFRTPLFPQARELAAMARRACPDALVVAGGVHASTRPLETVTRAPFHVAVRGEGDEAITALAEGKSFERIPGLTWPEGETAVGALIEDLDTLPFGAWDLFDLNHYRQQSLVARWTPVADLESSRGCRARCVYCTKGVFGNAYRVKSPTRFVDELEHARDHGFVGFNLVDDSFTTKTSRAIAICEEILRRDLKMPWTCTNGLRVANVNEDFFRLARAAGCYLVAFGFESGSNQVLKRIKKGATVQQASRAVAWARKHDMTVLGYFMVGLPGETADTIQETAEFAASLDVDFAKFSITMPLPGTPLYDSWAGHIRDQEHYDFSIHRDGARFFEHPDFSWPELERLTRGCYRTFYGRPAYVSRRLARAVRRGEFRREARYALDLVLPSAMEAFSRR